ncbi:MAG: hypothetical protein RLY70_1161, partial [Planctomycetota bacterium]
RISKGNVTGTRRGRRETWGAIPHAYDRRNWDLGLGDVLARGFARANDR